MTQENQRPTVDRRRILQSIGSGAVVGIGTLFSSGTAAAADKDQYHIEQLSPSEEGQLRGDVYSSSAFKTIRKKTRERGFQPQMGEVVGLRVENTETGTQRRALEIPCRVHPKNRGHGRGKGRGNGKPGDAGSNGVAVMYGIFADDRVQARCISQSEGEPVTVDTCIESAGGRSVDESDVMSTRILPVERGE